MAVNIMGATYKQTGELRREGSGMKEVGVG